MSPINSTYYQFPAVIRRSLKEPPPEEQPFPIRGYVLINLLFYVFLLLVYWAAYLLQRGETSGMIPVLAGLAVLFTLVTIYDATFDRVVYYRRLRARRKTRSAEEDAASDTHPGTASPAEAAAYRRKNHNDRE